MNQINYSCPRCGNIMLKTFSNVDANGSYRIDLKCPDVQCGYKSWRDDRLNYCRSCKGEMNRFINVSGHTVLKCTKCQNMWVSSTPAFKSGSGWGGKKGR